MGNDRNTRETGVVWSFDPATREGTIKDEEGMRVDISLDEDDEINTLEVGWKVSYEILDVVPTNRAINVKVLGQSDDPGE